MIRSVSQCHLGLRSRLWSVPPTSPTCVELRFTVTPVGLLSAAQSDCVHAVYSETEAASQQQQLPEAVLFQAAAGLSGWILAMQQRPSLCYGNNTG